MDLADLDPTRQDVDAMARRLQSAGSALHGRNLKRESWRLIANTLAEQSLGRIVLGRLRAATTRDDALRVLRIARKHGRNSAQSRKGSRRARPVRGRQHALDRRTAAEAGASAAVLEPDPWDWQDDDQDPDDRWLYPRDYRLWQTWDFLVRGPLGASVEARLPPPVERALRVLAQPMRVGLPADAAGVQVQLRAEHDWVDALTHHLRDEDVLPLPAADAAAIAACFRACQDNPAAPVLEGNTHFLSLLLLSAFWVRRAAAWTPPAGSAEVRFRSLLDHLFVQFPVPGFLYQAWGPTAGLHARAEKARLLFILLAQGASVRRVGAAIGWCLPKRLPGHFWAVPANYFVPSGLLLAEVLCLGGSSIEFHWLWAFPELHLDPTDGQCDTSLDPPCAAIPTRESLFLRETISWLVQHREALEGGAWEPILRWVVRQNFYGLYPRHDVVFSWAGRAPRATLALALDDLARRQEPWLDDTPWPTQGWDWQDDDAATGARWTVTELCSPRALHIEGEAMQHCVSAYYARCRAGSAAIFSLCLDGARVLTVHVDPRSCQIRQALGVRNRVSTAVERGVIDRWIAAVRAAGPLAES